jgi:spore maturation protein CgeB
MKISLIIMMDDYGDPARGPSYEAINFLGPLRSAGHDVHVFDYMAKMKARGRERMNSELIEEVKRHQSDVAIFSLFTDQIDPSSVTEIRSHCKTFCFFHDDTWRVEFSRFWASKFDFFSSPDYENVRNYPEIGLPNVFYFPFGFNEAVFSPSDAAKTIDVCFVGACHPYRAWLISRIRRAGIAVEVRGYGWPEGMVSHTEMVDLFNRSKISLNLSNSANWDARYLASRPLSAIRSLRLGKNREQIKARIFEVNGCGAFQLSYYVPGIERCFEIDEEIGIYTDPDDMVAKIRYYLSNDARREAIARAGAARARRDHTYAARFQNLFAHMGLQGLPKA